MRPALSWQRFISLGGAAYNRAEDAARQHDFKVIMPAGRFGMAATRKARNIPTASPRESLSPTNLLSWQNTHCRRR